MKMYVLATIYVLAGVCLYLLRLWFLNAPDAALLVVAFLLGVVFAGMHAIAQEYFDKKKN
jgi:hypothetical protein